MSHVVFPCTVPNSPPFCHACLHPSYLILFQWLQFSHAEGTVRGSCRPIAPLLEIQTALCFWSVLLNDAANYWGAMASGCVPQHDIRTFFLSERPNILGKHKWYCHSTTVMRTRFLCISVCAEAWNVLDKPCLNTLPLWANLQNTFPTFCSLFYTSYPPVNVILKKVNFLISNFHRVLNVIFFLLRDSPESEFYVPTFQNTVCYIFIGRAYTTNEDGAVFRNVGK